MRKIKNLNVNKRHGLCGLNNLANSFRNKYILDYESEDIIPSGWNDWSEIMRKEGYGVGIVPLIVNGSAFLQIPIEYFKSLIETMTQTSTNEVVNVFFINVQAGKSEDTLHAVSLLHNDGKWALTDPAKDETFRIEGIDEFYSIYEGNIIHVFHIYNYDTEEFSSLSINMFEDYIELFKD